jgi:uncharacterized heparinase superfamily protein
VEALPNPAFTPDGFGLKSYPDSGYYILEQAAGRGRLIADFGAPGESENPGHQHAGIFSFEVSTPAGRLIVDRGTSSYAQGPERDSLRGTAAHNTLRVDETDQFEVWKSFRVGRRAAVHDVTRGDIATGDAGAYSYVSAWHDGYRHLGIRHRRTIFNIRAGGWLIVDDLMGEGRRSVESYMHLDPRIRPRIEPSKQGSAIALQPDDWSIGLIEMPPALIQADLYSPRLGERLCAATVVGRAWAELPLRWIYWIAPFKPPALGWERTAGAQLILSSTGLLCITNLEVIDSY